MGLVHVWSALEGVIQVLDDECGADDRPRIKAAMAALRWCCSVIARHMDGF